MRRFYPERTLFIPQAINRISQGGFDGLVAHRYQSHAEGSQPGQRKDFPRQRDTVGKTVEPVLHHQIGHRRSKEHSRKYELRKVFGDQYGYTGNGRPENLADADLFLIVG